MADEDSSVQRRRGHYSVAEIAELLGLKPSYVRKLLHREGIKIAEFDRVARWLARELRDRGQLDD